MMIKMEDLNKQLEALGVGQEDTKPIEFIELLKNHLLAMQENSKKRTELVTENKMVQADWTMVMETRHTLIEQFTPRKKLKATSSIHSSTPNLANNADEADKIMTNSGSPGSSADSIHEENQLPNSAFSPNQNKSRIKLMELAFQREDNLAAHLRDYRFRSENTNRMLALKDNNVSRLEKEILRLKEMLVESKGKEKEMQSCISDLRLNLEDLEAQYDEDMTLSQLKEAEHNETMEHLTENNKRLTKENNEKSLELTKLRSFRLSPTSKISDKDDDSIKFNGQQSRSYDALSTSLQLNGNQYEMEINTELGDDSKTIPAMSKPTDQKVFLNGRIILSHSSNLQQIFRNHADFFNACKNNDTPFVTSQSADECRENEKAKLSSSVRETDFKVNKMKLFQSQQYLQSAQAFEEPLLQQQQQLSPHAFQSQQQLSQPQLTKQQGNQQIVNERQNNSTQNQSQSSKQKHQSMSQSQHKVHSKQSKQQPQPQKLQQKQPQQLQPHQQSQQKPQQHPQQQKQPQNQTHSSLNHRHQNQPQPKFSTQHHKQNQNQHQHPQCQQQHKLPQHPLPHSQHTNFPQNIQPQHLQQGHSKGHSEQNIQTKQKTENHQNKDLHQKDNHPFQQNPNSSNKKL